VGKFFSLEFYFGFQNIFSWKFSTWNKGNFSSLATDIVNKKSDSVFEAEPDEKYLFGLVFIS